MDMKMSDQIRDIMTKNNVVLGYIFGSYGNNKANSMSDLDVAVVLPIDMTTAEERKIEQKIQTEIGHATGIDRIDLINLRRCDNPVLRYSIIIEGNPIIVNDIALRRYLEMMAVRDFEDTRFLRSMSYNILKRKTQTYVAA